MFCGLEPPSSARRFDRALPGERHGSHRHHSGQPGAGRAGRRRRLEAPGDYGRKVGSEPAQRSALKNEQTPLGQFAVSPDGCAKGPTWSSVIIFSDKVLPAATAKVHED